MENNRLKHYFIKTIELRLDRDFIKFFPVENWRRFFIPGHRKLSLYDNEICFIYTSNLFQFVYIFFFVI